MTIGTGTVIFPLQNPQGTCAAYSQTWLTLSLIAGSPVMKAGVVHNQSMMSGIQPLAGGASLGALTANGMTPWAPVVLQNVSWHDAFASLAQAQVGFYYVTIKNPGHAMACYVDQDRILFLEPEDSLSQFNDAPSFVASMNAWYIARTLANGNQEFKYYRVTANAPAVAAPTTKQRPVLGGQRL